MPAAQSFLRRFLIYQKERFPLLVHVPLIAVFSFSAIAYSRLNQGLQSFIPWQNYVCCVWVNVVVFFLLRVSDEYKDQHDDALYRKYLPVPRGLVALKELFFVGAILFGTALLVNVFLYPMLLPLFAIVLVYLVLMRYEFFVAGWLKKHQVWYIISHMAIIPLADVYASAFDWKLNHQEPPFGLIFFLMVSFLNGIVLELGRKMRVADTEEPGVISYTNLWGIKKAPLVWLAVLTINAVFACIAATYTGNYTITIICLVAFFVMSAIPAVMFIQKPTQKNTKLIELMSLLWAFGMYLTLGGIPLLLKLVST